MIDFKSFRKNFNEATAMPVDEKPFKVGKYKAVVKKENNKFVAYLDGDKFDSFNSMAAAKRALTDFVDLLGKK
jgi:hypothetical protein